MSTFDANFSGWHDFDTEHQPEVREIPERYLETALLEKEMVLAMSYVKRQRWGDVLDCNAGLAKGTIFPELDKPFQGRGGYEK